MKPITTIVSRLMLVILFASLLPGCSKAPATSMPAEPAPRGQAARYPLPRSRPGQG